jgi:hypothetical protein
LTGIKRCKPVFARIGTIGHWRTNAERPYPSNCPRGTPEAVASIERYFRGTWRRSATSPRALCASSSRARSSIYNKAVADVQDRLQQRVSELDIEVHEDEFQYWRKHERQARARK